MGRFVGFVLATVVALVLVLALVFALQALSVDFDLRVMGAPVIVASVLGLTLVFYVADAAWRRFQISRYIRARDKLGSLSFLGGPVVTFSPRRQRRGWDGYSGLPFEFGGRYNFVMAPEKLTGLIAKTFPWLGQGEINREDSGGKGSVDFTSGHWRLRINYETARFGILRLSCELFLGDRTFDQTVIGWWLWRKSVVLPPGFIVVTAEEAKNCLSSLSIVLEEHVAPYLAHRDNATGILEAAESELDRVEQRLISLNQDHGAAAPEAETNSQGVKVLAGDVGAYIEWLANCDHYLRETLNLGQARK